MPEPTLHRTLRTSVARVAVLAAIVACSSSGSGTGGACPKCSGKYECGSDQLTLQEVGGKCIGDIDVSHNLEFTCDGRIVQSGQALGTWHGAADGTVTDTCETGGNCYSCTPK